MLRRMVLKAAAYTGGRAGDQEEDRDDGVEERPILVDTIELNSRQFDQMYRNEITEMSETFIFFGYATLYAAACPLATFIAFLHNIADVNLDLKAKCDLIRRKPATTRVGLGPWIEILEILAFCTVVTNALLLYFSTDKVSEYLEGQGMGSKNEYLQIVILAEHLILVVKVLARAWIRDEPAWVAKQLKKIRHEEDTLKQEAQDKEGQKKQQDQETRLRQLTKKHEAYTRTLMEAAKKRE
jgi:hypothetical protein